MNCFVTLQLVVNGTEHALSKEGNPTYCLIFHIKDILEDGIIYEYGLNKYIIPTILTHTWQTVLDILYFTANEGIGLVPVLLCKSMCDHWI